jgi:transposase
LLRVVRRRARLSAEALRIVDIDDWAWRHNHRYGSIVCDLERLRRVILSPNRELATAKAWLAGQPGLAIVARDSGGVYGEAIAKAPFWSSIAGIWCRTPAAWVAPRYVYSFA